MKLTDRQIEILEFCEKPRIAKEIAEYLNLQVNSIYKYMFDLTKDGYLKTRSAGADKPSGTKLFVTNQDSKIFNELKSTTCSDYVNVNLEFIKAAHNPFGINTQ